MKLRQTVIRICATAMNGALYAVLGYLTYLGLFTPVIGVVRFWPAVVVPGFFAAVYGPLVGGLGAAIGIFISDMCIHGNALLSLTVGVPANFLGFYVLGLLAGRKAGRLEVYGSAVFLLAVALLSVLLCSLMQVLDITTSIVFAVVSLVSMASILVVDRLYPEFSSFGLASVAGLALGSAIIGVGVWAFSQFLILPSGEMRLPVQAALIWFIWTFVTEIPFLTIVVPPVLRAFFKAYPGLRRVSTTRQKVSSKKG